MQKYTSIKNALITCAFLFAVIPAVDGGTFSHYLEVNDKAPLNKHVKQFVKNYIRENRETLSDIKKRSVSPFMIIDSVLTNYHLPLQLKYLAVVESELKTRAISRVGAVGPWQLMPETARILGLKVNARHDDRRNYYKSTKAAAIYLRDLHDTYKDWFLVFAAYNGGEVTVNRAIRITGSRNFWSIRKYLPAETREYVDKFIATTIYFEGGMTYKF